MAIRKPIMPAASDMLTGDGKLSHAGTHYLDDLARSMEAVIRNVEGAVEVWSWVIESPENRDYRLIINLPYPGAVNTQTTRCTAGTATVTGKINASALGGTANSASTSEQAQNHTTSNTFVAGDDYVVTVSGVSGCEYLTITVKVTRGLTA